MLEITIEWGNYMNDMKNAIKFSIILHFIILILIFFTFLGYLYYLKTKKGLVVGFSFVGPLGNNSFIYLIISFFFFTLLFMIVKKFGGNRKNKN